MVRSDLQQWLLPANSSASPARFSLPAKLLETSKTGWLAGKEAGTEVRSGTSEWLAPAGSRVPPLHLDCSPSSLAERLREGLLRAGAGFEKEKSAEAPAGGAQAEADLAEKLRRSLQTFNEKSAADWMAEEEDDEDSIMTLNTDTANTEDFDDFSDLQGDLDTWLAK